MRKVDDRPPNNGKAPKAKIKLDGEAPSRKATNETSRKATSAAPNLSSKEARSEGVLSKIEELANQAEKEIFRHHGHNLDVLLGVYDLARWILNDKDALNDFVMDPRWKDKRKRPSHESGDEILRFALSAVYGEDRKASQQVSKDFKMLQASLALATPSKVVRRLIDDAGGKEAFSRAEQERRRLLDDVDLQDNEFLLKLFDPKRVIKSYKGDSSKSLRLGITVTKRDGKILEGKVRPKKS